MAKRQVALIGRLTQPSTHQRGKAGFGTTGKSVSALPRSPHTTFNPQYMRASRHPAPLRYTRAPEGYIPSGVKPEGWSQRPVCTTGAGVWGPGERGHPNQQRWMGASASEMLVAA